MSELYWLVSAASLLGIWLNIRKRRVCFLIWAVTNAVWAVADWHHGLTAQAALQAIYFALSLYGLWAWRASKRRSVPDTAAPGR